MAQHGIIELEAMLEFVQGFLIALDVHQHVMCLVDFLDRVSHLTTAPVFQTMDATTACSQVGAITFDHGGHLLALIRVDDKYNFIMPHRDSFRFSPPLAVQWSKVKKQSPANRGLRIIRFFPD